MAEQPATTTNSGEGVVSIPEAEVQRWIASRMPEGLFYTFDRIKLNGTTGALEAKYTFSSATAPPPPTT